MLSNMTADAIKDWMMDRETHIDELVSDNLWRLIGLSRYMAWISRRQGIDVAVAKIVAPPAGGVAGIMGKEVQGLINAAVDDDRSKLPEELKNSRIPQFFPFIGKAYYWRIGGGQRSTAKQEIKRYEEIAKNGGSYMRRAVLGVGLTNYERSKLQQYAVEAFRNGWITDGKLDKLLEL